jgi:hypothetical protein
MRCLVVIASLVAKPHLPALRSLELTARFSCCSVTSNSTTHPPRQTNETKRPIGSWGGCCPSLGSVSCPSEINYLRSLNPEIDPQLEHMAPVLLDSSEYWILRRLEPQAEHHPADDTPRVVAIVTGSQNAEFTEVTVRIAKLCVKYCFQLKSGFPKSQMMIL